MLFYQVEAARLKLSHQAMAFVFGLAGVLSAAGHLWNFGGLSALRLAAYALVVFMAGFAAAYLLLFRIVAPRLAGYSPRARLAWSLACLAAGIFLAAAIPLQSATPPVKHILTVVATGTPDPQSAGDEVRLLAINTGAGIYPASTPDLCRGNWQKQGKALVAGQGQPATLTCEFPAVGRIVLTFEKGPSAGVVRLRSGEREVEKDLYSRKEGVVTVGVQNSLTVWQQTIHLLFVLADALWFGLFLFVASAWLVCRPTPLGIAGQPLPMPPRWMWVRYTLPLLVYWSVYWLAFWPALMSTDSLGQWAQMISGQYSDAHPAFHTLTNWLLTRLWFSPGAIAAAQILALSVVAGLGIALMRQEGAPAWLTWMVVTGVALSPANGMLAVTLWKDIPYSIALLGLTICLFLIVRSAGVWIEGHVAWLALGITTALTALYRHNGVIPAFASLACLFLAFPHRWKRLLAASLLASGLWLGVRGPFYRWLEVQPTQGNPFISVLALNVIDRHVNFDTPLLEDERQLLAQVRPGAPDWPYDCYNFTEFYYDGYLDHEFMARHSIDLARLALELSLRNPGETLQQWVCTGASVFQITAPRNTSYETAVGEIYANDMGLQSASRLPQVRTLLLRLAGETRTRRWVWLAWRSPFWMYLYFFAIAVACMRAKSWRYLLLAVPVGLNALQVAVFSVEQIFRYVYPMMLVGMVMSGPLLCVPSPVRSPVPGTGDRTEGSI
jgi:hypothetical protein